MQKQKMQRAANDCSGQKEVQQFDLTNVSDECENLLRSFENLNPICYSSFKMYVLEANTFLILAYRFLNAYGWNEKRLDIQEPISRGYFSQLYRKLGIIKIPTEQIYPILAQYDSVYVSYTFYYVSLHGQHWFDADADEDSFLALADDIIFNEFNEEYSEDNRTEIEEELLNSYFDATWQRELTQEAFHLLLEDYQLDIDYGTDEENGLLCDLGYSFYISDTEGEPQTNLYLYRSHLLYQLWQQKKDDPLMQSLFEKLFRCGLMKDPTREILYAIRVQSFSGGISEGRWVFLPDVLFALCILTLQGKEMAKESIKMQDAMQQDANWYQAHCKGEKGKK